MNKPNNHPELLKLRHTAEHVLMQAMDELFPGKIIKAMGPATQDGFYFDFETIDNLKISKLDFEAIEKKMQAIIDQDLPLVKQEITPQKAREIFKDNPYKQEWINEAEERGEPITIFYTGNPETQDTFVDLCSGPHLKSTGAIKAFKLLSVAGAYWKGDEKNKMLTRIYGTAFPSQKELKEYLHNLAEAKKRDHRQIGKDLKLFTFSDIVGKGLPLFTAKGAAIWREIERFVVDEELKAGYQHVRTPNLAKTDLYRTSGHYPYYKDTMYPTMKVDDEELILRPMTCPHHFALYQSQPRSYRELPLRFAELASLYRYEKSGELTGLIRVREFCLADSHNFCTPDQASQEIHSVLDLIEKISSAFGLEKGKNFTYRLSLGDRNNKDKYYHAPKKWEHAEKVLKQVLEDRQASYYEAVGEAAFYGPKIDIQMKNVLGKEDTAFTVQYDFCLPERFNLKYINDQGQTEQPIVIHRSSIGALERTIGFLIEHFAGAFPVWLSPIQVAILPISDKFNQKGEEIKQALVNQGLRVELNNSSESLGKKIRNAESQKIPYMLILGQKELDQNLISVRQRGEKDLGQMKLASFSAKIKEEIKQKLIF